MKAVLGTINGELLLDLTRSAAPFTTQVDAAVAYTAGPEHPLIQSCKEKGLYLTFYGLLDEGGAVNTRLLRELLAWGPSRAEVRLVKGHFHPKVIWWRGFGAYVGSANLTHKAWFNNVEAGIFLGEEELASTGVGEDLDEMFAHLAEHSIPVINELVAKLEALELDRRSLLEREAAMRRKFDALFGNLADNTGLTVKPAQGKAAKKENKPLQRFATEWMQTLQLMRGLAREFAELGQRPRWVDSDAHPAVHFDQFLHAYYYDYVRGGIAADDDDDEGASGLDRVEASFARHRSNPGAALREAARWWGGLTEDRYGEESFIRETAPRMEVALNRSAVAQLTLASFREAFRNVNAFRMHARQVKNVEFGLPPHHSVRISAIAIT